MAVLSSSIINGVLNIDGVLIVNGQKVALIDDV